MLYSVAEQSSSLGPGQAKNESSRHAPNPTQVVYAALMLRRVFASTALPLAHMFPETTRNALLVWKTTPDVLAACAPAFVRVRAVPV